jgi:ATP-binding cassette subfamily G (WHITE) protein 2
MRVIPAILFSVISYFMIGLTQTGGQFFIYLLTVFMTSLFGSALCFFIAATIPVFGKIMAFWYLCLSNYCSKHSSHD